MDCAAAAVVFAASAAVWALVTLVLVELSCLPVTASVLVVDRRASSTFTTRLLAPLVPTETVLASVAIEPRPSATALFARVAAS
ncbi:hypothetical protein D3C71_1936120 [compost metagenome]